MIPSLVANELRSALVEYLATTFALTDDDVHEKLREFLTHESDGIFRGPYLRVRTPFLSVGDDYDPPLQTLPEWMAPYQHQAKSFERLSSYEGRTPEPTLVTTGTGSGKTECFLLPVLDHCARMRAEGQAGIKAIILYPMNALASDQAGRIAQLISETPGYRNVTAGIYVGGDGRHTSMGEDNLIDKRAVMRVDPPDILLTNYKMLDFLLLRREDRDLWAENEPHTLQYVVLDEFHTYDGAQGTDVAMLLRRLGATLGMDDGHSPIGSATPVATSATMGSGDGAANSLCEFASKVFGTEITSDAVIGETRQSVAESTRSIEYSLTIPNPLEVAQLTDVDEIAAAFCSKVDEEGDLIPWTSGDQFELGERLLAHPLTQAVLAAVGSESRNWDSALNEILIRLPDWGRAAMRDREAVGNALARYIQLLSLARRPGWKADGHPLFSIEVQLWIREVSRVLRSVTTEPQFRWRDSACYEDDYTGYAADELPAAFCRNCGHSGWMTVRSEMGDSMLTNVSTIYEASLKRSPTQRVLLRANEDDATAQWYEPGERRIVETQTDTSVAVHITPTDDDARDGRCPTCDDRRSIRFLGLQIASLASVSLNTMFSSENVADEERKLIAFTDSVQDASHRASFFSGRTYRINLRSLMSRLVTDTGTMTLKELGESLLDAAESNHDVYSLVPPDLMRDSGIRTLWADSPNPIAREVLAKRLSFEAHLEFGSRSRVGRTLELSGASVAHVEVPDFDGCIDLLAEHFENQYESKADRLDQWLLGILERLRVRGAIVHPFLDKYTLDNGRQWHIWGGREAGCPPFTPGQSRPVFASTALKGDLDSLSALSTTPTWFVNWTSRVLGLDAKEARDFNQAAFVLLAKNDALVEVRSSSGTVYAIDSENIQITDLVNEAPDVNCSLCGQRQPVLDDRSDWVSTPCLRYRCEGQYELTTTDLRPNYYRDLYRSGSTRRVVTGEHTGLLNRDDREALERSFKTGTAPDSPNVLTATPTLEMGIDIGELSAVMLTSIPRGPANYIQRVGRAGRATGNSLVTTFAGSDSHSLYYLSTPEAMLSGEVRAPNCFLDAAETLERQYNAYLIDRIADRTIKMDDPIDTKIGNVLSGALKEGGLFDTMIKASTLETGHVERFLKLFGDNLGDETVSRLQEYAGGGIETALKSAVEVWNHGDRDLRNRRKRLDGSIERLEKQSHLNSDEEADLRDLKGQRTVVARLMREERNKYTFTELESLSVLPNYTLIDEATKLTATMWSESDSGEFSIDEYEYSRSATLALREFAPGNWFYAGGHRHLVDALEIGTADEPLYELWRLCPGCGYGRVEIEGDESPKNCPRCASTAIADTGAVHKMLKMRRAFASSSEEAARVYDERDERQRVFYETLQTADVDPTLVEGAWELKGTAFGAEFASHAQIRTINFGYSDRPGSKALVGGKEPHSTTFKICRHCGASADARDLVGRERPERLHQGWCKVRSGAEKEKWDQILLYHQLETDAVRLVLPISMFEITERLASFKGTLLLGLREDFGGNPEHLQILPTDMPNNAGQGRLQFLVLYDRVPGGTGYLSRLADPDRVKEIMKKGLEVLLRCQCRTEGRSACHRCLLGVIGRHEYDHVSRDLAIRLVDDLLRNWDPQPIPGGTIADISIARIEESELERRFKVAMQKWAEVTENVRMTSVPATERGRDAFEIRIGEGENLIRYRMEEQPGISTTPSTTPDFIFKRTDTNAPEIAIYLDGFQFHASSDINNIASDSEKRSGVRDSGRWVWSMTWEDVAKFHEAVAKETPRQPANRAVLSRSAKASAQKFQSQKNGRLDVSIADYNPMRLLLAYLNDPDDAAWNRLSRSIIGGVAAAAGTTPIDASTVRSSLQTALSGEQPDFAQTTDTPVALGAVHETTNGLALTVLLDDLEKSSEERWTVIAALPDDHQNVSSDQHAERWHDWLQWSNMLQFLGPIGSDRAAVITATSIPAEHTIDQLRIGRHGQEQGVEAEIYEPQHAATFSAEVEEELDLLEAPEVESLVRRALVGGAPLFTAGAEVGDGISVEAMWIEHGVGIAASGTTVPEGFDVRFADDWTVAELLSKLGVE